MSERTRTVGTERRGWARWRLLSLVLLTVMALVASACGSDDDDEASGGDDTTTTAASGETTETTAGEEEPVEPFNIRMALQQNNFAAIAVTLADDLGYLAEEDLTLEMTIGDSTATMTAGLLGGSFELQMGGTELVLAREEGAPIIGIAGLNNAPVWSLIAQPEYTTIESLRGKTLGTSGPDSISTLALNLALDAAGIPLEDINLVTSGGTSARYAAVEQGQIDGTIVSSPFEFVAEEAGLNNLGGLVQYEPYFTSALIATSESFAEENPDVLVRYLRAYVKASQWIHDPANEADLVERVARIVELEPDVVQSAYDYWIGGEYAEIMFPPDGHIEMQSLENVAGQYLELGILTEEPDLESFVVDDFRQEAEDSL